MFRLLSGLKQDGPASLLSKHRDKPSNHRLPAEVRTLALSIVWERYADFGPTLAAEKLAEHHGNLSTRAGHNVRPARPRECQTFDSWFEPRGLTDYDVWDWHSSDDYLSRRIVSLLM